MNGVDTRRRGCASIAPADDRFGIVNRFWSPLAARHGLRALALAPAGDCAEMFGELGGMSPSAAALNHLVEMVGAAWEVLEEETLESIRSAEVIPAEAAALSISLDGVMLGMRNEKDEAPQEEPVCAAATGFREASSGTVSYHGGDGERLRTIFFGRMPEAGKASLKRELVAEARHATGWRPDLDVVLIADGACDNWTFFSQAFPETTEILDFWHAAQHLKKALDSAHGEHSPEAQRRFEKLRQRLRDEENGIDQVLRSLRHLAKTYPKRTTISRVLKFFRKHRLRMRCAEFQTRKLPILSMRALCKSGRFHAVWREIIRALQPPPYHLVKRKSGNVAKLMN